MDRDAMIEVVQKANKFQDDGDIEGQLTLYAEDCTFKMPINHRPMRGLAELRKSVEQWPKSVTNSEWFVVEGNRLTTAWNWRAQDAPEGTPLLRGVSLFVFNDDGLIQDYEDFFDPDWIKRHAKTG